MAKCCYVDLIHPSGDQVNTAVADWRGRLPAAASRRGRPALSRRTRNSPSSCMLLPGGHFGSSAPKSAICDCAIRLRYERRTVPCCPQSPFFYGGGRDKANDDRLDDLMFASSVVRQSFLRTLLCHKLDALVQLRKDEGQGGPCCLVLGVFIEGTRKGHRFVRKPSRGSVQARADRYFLQPK
jgi:hypothetical protein